MNESLAYQDAPDSEPWREELIGGTWVAIVQNAISFTI